MPKRNRTARDWIAFAALAWTTSALLYLGGGCATGGGEAARNETALQSYVQGVKAYQNGDTTKALTNLQEAVKKKSDLVMARSMLGDLYRSQSDYDSAREQYEIVARLDPYEYSNHYRLGLAYQLLEKVREAAASYLKAVKLNPRDWRSCMNLGLVYMSLGENNSAVEYCQRAVNLNPLSAVAYANLGVVFDARGNAPEAETAYRRSLTIDPTQTGPAVNLARNLQYRGKSAEAVTVLERLTTAADSAMVRRRYGDALASAGREGDALYQYRRALKLDPRHYPAMNALAALLITQYRNGLLLDDRKRDEAVAMWKQSLVLNPEQPKVEAQLKAWGPKAG